MEHPHEEVTVGKRLLVGMLMVPAMLWGCGSDGQGPGNGYPNDHGYNTGTDPNGGTWPNNTAGTGGIAPNGTGGTPAQQRIGLPCDVASVLTTHCANCHGDPVDWSAPMSLVSHEDFRAQGVLSSGQRVDALVQARIHDQVSPMPPRTAPAMSDQDRAILDAWLNAGSPPGSEGDSCIVQTPTQNPQDDHDPTGGHISATCYELRNHGQPVAGDTSAYNVGTGEHYVEFYFDPPWPEPSVLVGFRTLYDKTPLLHHWLLYKTNSTRPDGYFQGGIGTHIGEQVELIAGWAVGGNDMELPNGVAAALPPPSGKLMIEWHYYNTTGQQQQDQSGVEVCVVPASEVEQNKVATITWVGSEDLGGNSLLGVIGFAGMPPGQETKIQDTCTPSFNNVPPGEPVRIFSFIPHMHAIGRNMRTWVARQNGTVEKVFDEPFQFDHQISYIMDPVIELWPGDKLVNECTFFNDTSGLVGFGPSSDQEMCYQFTYAYPANALQNGAPSLTGASNTCWDNNPFQAAQLIAAAGD